MYIKSLKDLTETKKTFQEQETQYPFVAHVCYAAGCLSSDCREVKDALIKALEHEKLTDKVKIKLTGCMGACTLGPTLIINPGQTLYCNLKPSDMPHIVKEHIKKGKIAGKYCFKDPETGKEIHNMQEINFFKLQKKIVLRNCGSVDFASLEEYIANDGYFALCKAITTMTPGQVIDEVKRSGMRGRGGGGFPTGLKWELASKVENDQKYIICNADEGDPGAFMDRSLLEGDAHAVIEGMIIGGYAIGASKGVVTFVRNIQLR